MVRFKDGMGCVSSLAGPIEIGRPETKTHSRCPIVAQQVVRYCPQCLGLFTRS